MKISIIVPVYNAERYLDQCVESLVNQTYTNIEIILIDDGAKDRSGVICDKWAKKDQRVMAIHKENEGASEARKRGVFVATGQYVCFLDSDDYAEPSFCQKMIHQMVIQKAELVECAYYKFTDTKSAAHLPWKEVLVLDEEEFRNIVVRQTIVDGTEAVVMWNKMYLRKAIIDYVIEYGEDVLEDYLFNAQYYCGVRKYVYIPECLVNYRQVNNSLSRRCNLQTFEILKKVDEEKMRCMKRLGLTTPTDIKLADRWFVRYTYAFLTNYLQSANNIERGFVTRILTDAALIEKCERISDVHSWSKLVAVGEKEAAFRYLRQTVTCNKIRCQLAKIKGKLKR